MYVQIFPGKDASRWTSGFTIPVSNTLPDVDLDEILAELDARTRDYVTLLANGGGEGLQRPRQGPRAAASSATARPCATSRASTRPSRKERIALRRLVTSLAQLNRTLARKPRDLAAARRTRLGDARARSPPRTTTCATPSASCAALQQATSTLNDVKPFADELGPATRRAAAGGPGARIASTRRSARSRARPRRSCATRSGRSCAARSRWSRDLAPAARGLARSLPELHRGCRRSTTSSTCSAYNPRGREAPDAAGREEGYLFWLGLADAPDREPQNVDDANGPMRPIFLTGTCETIIEPRQRPAAARVPARALAAAGAPSARTRRRRRCGHEDALERSASRPRRAEVNTAAPDARADHRHRRLLAVVLRACCCSSGWRSAGRSRSSRRATASQVSFTDATTLADQADVRMAGVYDRQGRQEGARPGGQHDDRDDRAGQPLRAAALGRAGDPAPEDAARRDLRRADPRHTDAPALRRTRGWTTGRSRRRSSSTSCCRSSTSRRARHFRSGRRASRRPAPAAAATSTMRSATCRSFAENAQRPRRRARTTAAARCATSSPTEGTRSRRSRATRSALATLVQRTPSCSASWPSGATRWRSRSRSCRRSSTSPS